MKRLGVGCWRMTTSRAINAVFAVAVAAFGRELLPGVRETGPTAPHLARFADIARKVGLKDRSLRS